MLCSVHDGRKGKESNKHHQQRWMRLQIVFRGREFLLVSALSNTTSSSGTWLVDNGACCRPNAHLQT
jgi:hypothetical protein